MPDKNPIQHRLLVMFDKNNAFVLSETQSKMSIAAAKDVMTREKKYMRHLHCFRPEWYIQERYVVSPRNLPSFYGARTKLMGELREDGYNII